MSERSELVPWCRTYWGHCGCDLPRGHPGPHAGLHWNEDQTEATSVHVMGRGRPELFGEDATDD